MAMILDDCLLILALVGLMFCLAIVMNEIIF
jgi:hypothetical protein